MKTLNIIGLSVLMCTAVSGFAQEENKLKVNPTGRILMDGGMFQSKSDNFVNGVAIPDVRVGVKASYGKYKAKVDVGYAYGKVSLKDIFVERQMTSHSLLRVGNFVHQFGLQSSTSSSMKITMEEPASNEAFFNSRLIGAMYIFDKDAFFGTASVHAENEALKKKASSMGGKMGYGAMSRLVYRPLRAEGLLFQAGISGAYESPRYNSDEKLNHSNIDPSSSENDDEEEEDCYGIKRSVMVTTSVVLTRKQLNEIINSQLTECINLIDLVLKRNGLTSNDITKIILVGGSSRLPLLETKILEIFDNSKISRSLNPDECVSRGACQFGLSTAIFTDCLHHNIYHLVGRPNDEKSYRVLLKEGTPLPCSATKTYTIRPDRPTTFFKDTLYQGPKPLESIQLAPMIVSGYTIDPDNDITVTYTIKVSEERILSFTVMDDRTKKILIQDSGPILHKHR